MNDLADFLLARIAEDEAVANAATNDAVHIARWDPARVLAECEAKRRIIEWTVRLLDMLTDEERRRRYGDRQPLELRALALPCADHSDYREEWRL